jgi:hypothetical protein
VFLLLLTVSLMYYLNLYSMTLIRSDLATFADSLLAGGEMPSSFGDGPVSAPKQALLPFFLWLPRCCQNLTRGGGSSSFLIAEESSSSLLTHNFNSLRPWVPTPEESAYLYYSPVPFTNVLLFFVVAFVVVCSLVALN